MKYEQFRESLSSNKPPDNITVYLRALWFDAKDDWEKAHTIIQETEDMNAAWIHAYLHRKEGDTGNADYWYHRAGKKRPGITVEQEWETIVTALTHH